MNKNIRHTLDVRGLKCPLPVLKLQHFLKKCAPNDEVEILTNDPMAQIDIPHFCSEKNHTLIAITKVADYLAIKVQKK